MQRDVWLITGIPGAGKSTVARTLAGRFPRAAHIEGDLLAEWVVSGRVLPGEEPDTESARQIYLCQRNQCVLARSFCEDDIVPVLDYVVPMQSRLSDYQRHLRGFALHLVVLAPGAAVALHRDQHRLKTGIAASWTWLEEIFDSELRGTGLWLDTAALTAEETADAILANRRGARV